MFRSAVSSVNVAGPTRKACQQCLCSRMRPSGPTVRPAVASSAGQLSTRAAQLAERVTPVDEHQGAPIVLPSKQQHHLKKAGPTKSHKPPKRRLEAASQPLRNVASESRGPVLQCIAHSTAEKYDLPALVTVLRQLGVKYDEVPEGDRERAIVIGHWKGRGGGERLVRGKDIKRAGASSVDEALDEDDSSGGFHYGERGEIWVFGSGCYVTWGLSEEEGRAFLREVIRRKGASVEIERLLDREVEMEEVDFVVDPRAATHIMGNLILLGGPPELSTFERSSQGLASLLTRYTLSLSLSRSSSLSVLEGRLDRHINSVSGLPAALMRSGAQPMGRKEVIRKLGELMTLRMAVNARGGGLEDTPEIYWSEPELECKPSSLAVFTANDFAAYFDSIATEFEIKERIDAFNKKLDYAQEIQSTLRALLTEASGHRMELIIILLIAVEVVIVLIREGAEMGHKISNTMKGLLGLASADSSANDVQQAAQQVGALVAEVAERLPHLGHALDPAAPVLADDSRRLV